MIPTIEVIITFSAPLAILMKLLMHVALLGCILMVLGAARAQGQSSPWQSVLSAQGQRSQIAAVAADGRGNLYVAGFFRDVLTLGGLTLTSAGEEDVFVAKWQIASRTFVWAERVGGPYSDAATALAVRDSILYVAGSFNGGNGRGGGTVAFGNNVLTSPGNSDCFVARLTDNGSHARFGWAMQAGGALNDAVRAIAVRDSSVYVAGHYQNPGATFGTTVSPSVGAVGSSEGFLPRVADAGATASLAWTYRLGGAGEDDAYAVAVQGQAVYVARYF